MRFAFIILCMLLVSSYSLAGGNKENERLQKAATVLEEILDMPDGLSAELLDKAECVVVLPSVKKLALGIGGRYGRGAMVCREGRDFQGPWGPPVMMALEGGNIGFRDRWTIYRFPPPRDERERRELGPQEQGQAGSRRLSRGRSQGSNRGSLHRRLYDGRDSELLAFTGALRRSLVGRLDAPAGQRGQRRHLRS